jgi:hypothetical protein
MSAFFEKSYVSSRILDFTDPFNSVKGHQNIEYLGSTIDHENFFNSDIFNAIMEVLSFELLLIPYSMEQIPS